LRRGSLLLLVSSCVAGLFLGSSYLGESSSQASGGQAGRLVEAREAIAQPLLENGREIAYALEGAFNEIRDLIP
jgi:hypothetical protein